MTKEGALKLKAQRTAEVLKIMEWDSDMVPELYALYDRIWDENGNRRQPEQKPIAQPLPSVQVLIDALEKIKEESYHTRYENKAYQISKQVLDQFKYQVPVEDGWISVDNPPKKTGQYLGYDPNLYGKNKVDIFRYDDYNNTWFILSDVYHPTHWQPLPSIPKQ